MASSRLLCCRRLLGRILLLLCIILVSLAAYPYLLLSRIRTPFLTRRKDCGVTHFHDKAIREALTKIAPGEKERLAKMDFGEITGS